MGAEEEVANRGQRSDAKLGQSTLVAKHSAVPT